MTMIDLSQEQFMCKDLRKTAPDHTYENDLQVFLGMKSLLDLNMGIPSTEVEWFVDLIHRGHGGQMQGQKALLALLLPFIVMPPVPTTDTELKADEPLYNQAVEFARYELTMSVSRMQRKFLIGYNRAARICERLQAEGVLIRTRDGWRRA